jgi:restriction system protein
VFDTAQRVTEEQLSSLVRKRRQLVQPDAYGNLVLERWVKEVDYFISTSIKPRLASDEQFALPEYSMEIAHHIEEAVRGAALDRPTAQAFWDDMKPLEFEHFCAEELRRAGWNARVTMQSRDQGVDVVADKGRCRIILQCKLYTRPVGNKSVQEAAAGRVHEGADYGIVVSNAGYTKAAEQLASTNGVLLLHYSDLPNLENLLRQQAFSIRAVR